MDGCIRVSLLECLTVAVATVIQFLVVAICFLSSDVAVLSHILTL